MDTLKRCGAIILTWIGQAVVGFIAATCLEAAVANDLIRDIGIVVIWVTVIIVGVALLIWAPWLKRTATPTKSINQAEAAPGPKQESSTTLQLSDEYAQNALLFLGMVEDQVGPGPSDSDCDKDGQLDGTFELRIGPMRHILTEIELRNPKAGGIWKTAPDDRFWVLGVSRGGRRLNQQKRVLLHEDLAGGMVLELFASDDRGNPYHFPTGSLFEGHIRLEGMNQPTVVHAKRRL